MQAWTVLVLAGLLEVVWAVALKFSDGFARPWTIVITIGSMVASMGLLGIAVRELPIGTAYAVWVGVGVVGTFLAGLVLLGESFSWARAGFLLLLVVALVGLKVTTPS